VVSRGRPPRGGTISSSPADPVLRGGFHVSGGRKRGRGTYKGCRDSSLDCSRRPWDLVWSTGRTESYGSRERDESLERNLGTRLVATVCGISRSSAPVRDQDAIQRLHSDGIAIFSSIDAGDVEVHPVGSVELEAQRDVHQRAERTSIQSQSS
jgi:hypothetical protein